MNMYQKRKMRKENREKNSKKQDNSQQVNINWYPGHMAKTKREIQEKINLIDIVFEIIDSRIPSSSKNKEIDSMIKNKPRVLIMTKSDLCDIEESKKWQQHYEKQGYKVVMLNLMSGEKLTPIFNITNQIAASLNEKRQKKGLKPRKLRILILGIPNVGKSTLINRLVGKKATNVGNKPGITKKLEWIRINNDLELLDTPGILWPKLDGDNVALNLASTTAIKEEILNKEQIAIYIIQTLKKLYPKALEERYKLTDEEDIVEILDKIGKTIGAIKNNETDYEKVYTIILKDLREGYLGRITLDRYEDR